MSGKKPTMMEVKNAINNLIHEFSNLSTYLRNLDQTLGLYIDYKKDSEKFQKWAKKQAERAKALGEKEAKKKESK